MTGSPSTATSGSPASGGNTAVPLLTSPLETRTRVDDIEARLVTAIAVGEYLPGARLPAERELATALGVGRETVRQALSRLIERGLLETQRGRGGGSFVRSDWPASSVDIVHRELTARWESLRDTMDAVSRLHGVVAEAAAEHRTDQDVEILRARLADFLDAESGIPAQQADSKLHLAIIDSAHNVALRGVLLQLESTVSINAPTHPWGDPDTMRELEPRALEDHTNLVDAICRGERAEASEIARRHVLIDIEIIERAMNQYQR